MGTATARTTRAAYCKHLQAVALEEQALRQFAADWDNRATQARAALDDLPGDFLDSEMHFADTSLLLSPEDQEWLADDVNRDAYRGPYGSDGWSQPRPCCPTCGAELETRSYYVGGRGYQYFEVCTADMAHHARQA